MNNTWRSYDCLANSGKGVLPALDAYIARKGIHLSASRWRDLLKRTCGGKKTEVFYLREELGSPGSKSISVIFRKTAMLAILQEVRKNGHLDSFQLEMHSDGYQSLTRSDGCLCLQMMPLSEPRRVIFQFWLDFDFLAS